MVAFFSKLLSFRSPESKSYILGETRLKNHFAAICAQNTPCCLIVEGRYNEDIVAEFQSRFIQLQHGHIIIDNMKPEHGNKLLEKIHGWQVRYSVNGMCYNFKTPLTAYRNNSTVMLGFAVPDIVFGYPTHIQGEIVPDPAKPIEIRFALNPHQKITGTVRSISPRQAVLKFTDSPLSLVKNQIIPNSYIVFPGGVTIHVHLFVLVALVDQVTVKIQLKSDNEYSKLIYQLQNY